MPNWETSNARASEYLNQAVPTLESLDQLEALLEKSQIRHEELQARVRSAWMIVLFLLMVTVPAQLSSSNERTRTLITDTRNSAEEQLTTSQDLSLLRHSLADELAELSNELISVLYDENREPTLLEDIETLHRSLKELESVKGYVLVIQHGLKLRLAFGIFTPGRG